jgi:hypothetical protein
MGSLRTSIFLVNIFAHLDPDPDPADQNQFGSMRNRNRIHKIEYKLIKDEKILAKARSAKTPPEDRCSPLLDKNQALPIRALP